MDFENGFYAMDFGDSLNTFTTSNNDSRMSIDLSKTYVDEVEIKLMESVDFNDCQKGMRRGFEVEITEKKVTV